MECEVPQHNSTTKEIAELFNTIKTIAIIGLSPDASKPSNRVAAYLQDQGYTIIPVYPKEDTILGQKVFRTLDSIDTQVDCVTIFRKPEACLPIVKEAIKLQGLKAVWMQEGIVNNEAADIATQKGLQVVQNKCMMIEHKAMDA